MTDSSIHRHNPSARAGAPGTVPPELLGAGGSEPGHRAAVAFILLAYVGGMLFLLHRGPALSTHEVLVAQTARQTLETGEWTVLQYLDASFLVKPPLAPWLAAVSGMLYPEDAVTGQRVTTAAARLPSLAATLLTAWIVFALGRSMFGPSIAGCAAFVFATLVGVLLFALNATAEALLTLFCTWCFAEFWWAQSATGRRRILHQIRFYCAFGLAMLAKGPMPLAVVAVPIAAWWWLDRPTRHIATCGPKGLFGAIRLALMEIFPRLRMAVTKLGIIWGLPLAALIFMPWMFAVARHVPWFWQLWNHEYLDRFQNDNLWVRNGGFIYYLPVLLGYTVPWLLSLPEALASPFLAKYRKHRRPLTYAWYWAVGTIVVLTCMTFKQGYYLLTALPGIALLLGPVLHDLFFATSPSPRARLVRVIYYAILIATLIAVTITWFAMRHIFAEEWTPAAAWGAAFLAIFILTGVALAGWEFLAGRPRRCFVIVGMSAFCVFGITWCVLGPRLDDVADSMALAEQLEKSEIGRDENVYWAGNQPDGRVVFYANRPIRQVVDPFELRAKNAGADKTDLQLMVGRRISHLLAEDEPVFFVITREQFDMLMLVLRPTAFVWFDIDRGRTGPDDEDWLVVSNQPAPEHTKPPHSGES